MHRSVCLNFVSYGVSSQCYICSWCNTSEGVWSINHNNSWKTNLRISNNWVGISFVCQYHCIFKPYRLSWPINYSSAYIHIYIYDPSRGESEMNFMKHHIFHSAPPLNRRSLKTLWNSDVWCSIECHLMKIPLQINITILAVAPQFIRFYIFLSLSLSNLE